MKSTEWVDANMVANMSTKSVCCCSLLFTSFCSQSNVKCKKCTEKKKNENTILKDLCITIDDTAYIRIRSDTLLFSHHFRWHCVLGSNACRQMNQLQNHQVMIWFCAHSQRLCPLKWQRLTYQHTDIRTYEATSFHWLINHSACERNTWKVWIWRVNRVNFA